jgi:plastocyanin
LRCDFFLRLTEAPNYGRFSAIYDIRETIKETSAADLLGGNAGCMAFLPAAESDNNRSAASTGKKRGLPAVRIVDQHGRHLRSGRRLAGSQVFDVAVGPIGNKLRFVPDTLNISVGDTVRWSWGSDNHSVTSGTSCTADEEFCSPDNMNCDTGILSNTGFVYEHTLTQAGSYSYFCALHCFAEMTGVINVTQPSRPHPTPRPRPTPHPRPFPPQ